VFVWIFETRVDEHGRRAALEPLLEIFFGDPRWWHGAYCDRAPRALSNQRAAAVRVNGSTLGDATASGATVSGATARAGIATGCARTVAAFEWTVHPSERFPQ
jgi:hypothetical protein